MCIRSVKGGLSNRKLATNIYDDGDTVSVEGLTAVGPEIGAIVEVQIAGPQAGLRLKALDYLEKTKQSISESGTIPWLQAVHRYAKLSGKPTSGHEIIFLSCFVLVN